jgi:hypothetical protein
MRKTFHLLLALVVWAQVAAAAEPISLTDLSGKQHQPLAVGDKKAVVLVFISPFCPTSNTFTPEVNKIAAEYGDRFAFYLVQAEAGISAADAKKHADLFEIKAPVLLDPEHKLARLTQAKITPEAMVLSAKGEMLYQGRINDLYATQTKKLPEPKTHDLRVALDEIAAGKPVTTARTKAIGCSITLTSAQ